MARLLPAHCPCHVTGLDKNTGEARRALYERARTALCCAIARDRAAASGIGDHQGAPGPRGGDPQGRGRGRPPLPYRDGSTVRGCGAFRSRTGSAPFSSECGSTCGQGATAARSAAACRACARCAETHHAGFGPKTLPPLTPRPSAQSAPPPKNHRHSMRRRRRSGHRSAPTLGSHLRATAPATRSVRGDAAVTSTSRWSRGWRRKISAARCIRPRCHRRRAIAVVRRRIGRFKIRRFRIRPIGGRPPAASTRGHGR